MVNQFLIRVTRKTAKKIKDRKLTPNESYDQILDRLIDNDNEKEQNL